MERHGVGCAGVLPWRPLGLLAPLLGRQAAARGTNGAVQVAAPSLPARAWIATWRPVEAHGRYYFPVPCCGRPLQSMATVLSLLLALADVRSPSEKGISCRGASPASWELLWVAGAVAGGSSLWSFVRQFDRAYYTAA